MQTVNVTDKPDNHYNKMNAKKLMRKIHHYKQDNVTIYIPIWLFFLGRIIYTIDSQSFTTNEV